MRIAGLQKMTLLDFPGKVACTVFLPGCNFRCPFCHNGGILEVSAHEQISEEAFFRFLEGRQGLLDGVCVSGGEPTCSAQLPEFLAKIKALGFAVKLDTNGSHPDMLRQLMERQLVDYVAMDVKNSPDAYGKTVGLSDPPMEAVEQSLRLLMGSQVDYELRTTVVRQLHDEASVEAMGKWLYGLRGNQKIPKIFLQPFVNRDSVLDQNLLAPENGEIAHFVELLCTFAQEVSVRG